MLQIKIIILENRLDVLRKANSKILISMHVPHMTQNLDGKMRVGKF